MAETDYASMAQALCDLVNAAEAALIIFDASVRDAGHRNPIVQLKKGRPDSLRAVDAAFDAYSKVKQGENA